MLVTRDCGPAVLGFWHPRIVIPRWALGLDPHARSLMLQHEREHLRARDPQLLVIALVTGLLFPWNAALWFIVRRLRLAIELDCDDRVLRRYADVRGYGALLLAVCAHRGQKMPFALPLAERFSMLERRIKAMTAVTPHRRLLVSIPLVLAVVLLSAAAARTPNPAPSWRSAPRLAIPESLPLISATWENAPIESVVAAFAAFSHRRIATAPGGAGLITGAPASPNFTPLAKTSYSAPAA